MLDWSRLRELYAKHSGNSETTFAALKAHKIEVFTLDCKSFDDFLSLLVPNSEFLKSLNLKKTNKSSAEK